MKIYFFNDRTRQASVTVQGGEDAFVRLQPAGGRVFELDIPEGAIPFVKVWETNQVLISYTEEEYDEEKEDVSVGQ